MMRALIIGGTGHIGSAIVREMVAAKWRVTVLSRGAKPSRNLRDVAVAWRRGDGHREADLRAAATGMDLVVDAAAPYPVHPGAPTSAADREPVDFAIRRTRALVAACADTTLITIGSFATHQLLQQPGVALYRRLRSRATRRLHPYFAVKSAVEVTLLRAANRGQRIGIINPTGCLGPWDLKPRDLCLIPMVACGELPATTSDTVNFIDVRDVALAVRRMSETEFLGTPVLLAGHSLPFPTYFERIAAAAGGRPPRLRAPAVLGVATLWAAERTLGVAGRRPPWPSLSMFLVAECGIVEPSAAQQGLGVQPRPLEDTIEDALRWYREIGYC